MSIRVAAAEIFRCGMAMTYTAQFGEDRLLEGHFGGRRTGFYLEVGAFDGVKMSNTHRFEFLGWRGILIEADPELAAKCKVVRPRSIIVNCAVVAPGNLDTVSFELNESLEGTSSLSVDRAHVSSLIGRPTFIRTRPITVRARTLDSVLLEHSAPQIDFMSIDVEGFELAVLQGFTLLRWLPEIVIVERNRVFPDRRILRYFSTGGYRYLRTTGVNDWFIRPDKITAGPFATWARILVCLYFRSAWRALRATIHRMRRS